jgi:hypothetical protein
VRQRQEIQKVLPALTGYFFSNASDVGLFDFLAFLAARFSLRDKVAFLNVSLRVLRSFDMAMVLPIGYITLYRTFRRD